MFLQCEDAARFQFGHFNDLIVTTIGGDWGDSVESSGKKQVVCIRGADIPNLNAGSIVNAPIRYIPSKNAVVKKAIANDIIVEISGGSPTQSTGRIALIAEQAIDKFNSTFICSNFCRIVRVKTEYLSYFVEYWNYLYRNNRLFCYENSSTGLKNFDLDSFLTDEDIPIPPKELSIQFNEIVAPFRRQILQNGFEITELENTKPTVLPKYLSRR